MNLSDMLGESWLDVNGFEGKYQISNMGRAKVLNRQNRGYSQIMSQQLSKTNGRYLLVQFYFGNKPYTFSVARLVGNHFVPNPNNLPEINHLFGNKLDNRATELEWCTRLHNLRHAVDVLGVNCGINHFRSKFTEKQVLDIYNSKKGHRELGRKYGVSHSTIMAIKDKKSYKKILNGI